MHRMITANALTHEELAVLGLRARDTNPTPVPVPTGAHKLIRTVIKTILAAA